MHPHSLLLSLAPSPPHFRLKIPPFEKAREVLEALQQHRPVRVQEGMCMYLSEQANKCIAGSGVSSLAQVHPFLALGPFPFPCSVGGRGLGGGLLLRHGL